MSKFFKRIGTKATKFQFEAEIQRIDLSLSFACNIKIIWKRGNHVIETLRQAMLDPKKGFVSFSESLVLDATLFYEPKLKSYQEKKSTFTVIMETIKGNKQAGICTYELSQIVNKNIQNQVFVTQLEKCPDKNAKLTFSIKCTKLGDVNESQVSDVDTSRDELEFGKEQRSKARSNSQIYTAQNFEMGSPKKSNQVQQQERRNSLENIRESIEYRASRVSKINNANQDNIDFIEEKKQNQQQSEIQDKQQLQTINKQTNERQENKKIQQSQLNKIQEKQSNQITFSPTQVINLEDDEQKKTFMSSDINKKDQQQISKQNTQNQSLPTKTTLTNITSNQQKNQDTKQEQKKNEVEQQDEEDKQNVDIIQLEDIINPNNANEGDDDIIILDDDEDEDNKHKKTTEGQNKKNDTDKKLKESDMIVPQDDVSPNINTMQFKPNNKPMASRGYDQLFQNNDKIVINNKTQIQQQQQQQQLQQQNNNQQQIVQNQQSSGQQKRNPIFSNHQQKPLETPVIQQPPINTINQQGINQTNTQIKNSDSYKEQQQQPPAQPNKDRRFSQMQPSSQPLIMQASQQAQQQIVDPYSSQNRQNMSNQAQTQNLNQQPASISNNNQVPQQQKQQFDIKINQVEMIDKCLNLENKVKEKNIEIEQYLRKINELEREKEQIRQIEQKSASNISNIQKNLQVELEREKKRNKELEDSLNNANNEINKMQQNFKKLETAHKNFMADFQNLKQENATLKDQIDIASNKSNELQSNNKLVDLELKKRLDKINTLQSEVTRLRDEVNKLENENSKIQKNNIDYQHRLSIIQHERENDQISQTDDSKKQEQYYQNLSQKQDQDIQELKKQLRMAEQDREEALSKETKSSIEIQRLQIEIDKTKKHYDIVIASLKDETDNLGGNKNQSQLQKENLMLKERIQVLESSNDENNQESLNQIQNLENKLLQKDEIIQQQENDLSNLEQQISSLESQIREKTKAVGLLEIAKKKLEQQQLLHSQEIIEKDQIIKEKDNQLESQSKKYQEQIIKLAKQDIKSNQLPIDSDEELRQKNEELEQRIIKLEEEATIEREQYQREIDKLKQQRQVTFKGQVGFSQESDDIEVTKLSIENEQLKNELKEIQKQNQQSAKGDDQKNRIKELEKENLRMKDEIVKSQLALKNMEKDMGSNTQLVKKQEEKVREMQEQLTNMEQQLVKTKQQLGDAINASMDYGGPDLVDKIQIAMQKREKRNY